MKAARAFALTPAAIISEANVWRHSWRPIGVIPASSHARRARAQIVEVLNARTSLRPTGDESRNLAWLAPLSLGEAWHNIHHAFPTSARHGLGRWQLDPSAWLITALERCRLAWGPSADHARTPTSQARRLITAQRAGQGLRVNSTEEGVMVLA
jgi:hypothetical protein